MPKEKKPRVKYQITVTVEVELTDTRDPLKAVPLLFNAARTYDKNFSKKVEKV
jgi:hypothetical protein